jgi:3-oxoacyl-[acyl-carrier protein] reductase
MIAQRSGKIINLSSQLALIGWDKAAVYAGSKGFILTWTKSLARELGQYNINVNAIGPGSIITDMNRSLYASPEAAERRAQELPLRRFGTPRDVGECALFLASDAGNYLTGQMLWPNGGNVM